MKEVTIDQLKVGDIVLIEGVPREMDDNVITYIGKGVGCYKDRFDNEFTFATSFVRFFIKEK